MWAVPDVIQAFTCPFARLPSKPLPSTDAWRPAAIALFIPNPSLIGNPYADRGTDHRLRSLAKNGSLDTARTTGSDDETSFVIRFVLTAARLIVSRNFSDFFDMLPSTAECRRLGIRLFLSIYIRCCGLSGASWFHLTHSYMSMRATRTQACLTGCPLKVLFSWADVPNLPYLKG